MSFISEFKTFKVNEMFSSNGISLTFLFLGTYLLGASIYDFSAISFILTVVQKPISLEYSFSYQKGLTKSVICDIVFIEHGNIF